MQKCVLLTSPAIGASRPLAPVLLDFASVLKSQLFAAQVRPPWPPSDPRPVRSVPRITLCFYFPL